MKYLSKVLLVLSLLLAVVACDDDALTPEANGSLILSSTPAGALISIDGVSTEQVTPATVEAKSGLRDVTLSLANYKDTTFAISVSPDQPSVVSVILKPSFVSLSVTSNPAGAAIWINGANSGQVTPYVFTDKTVGTYEITLKKDNFDDYMETVTLSENTNSVSAELVPMYATFSTIKLWETVGTTSTQPSGLDLSAGDALSITTSSGVNGNVDIYYSSEGFIVRSANGKNSMTRETYFKVAAGSDLTDGVDSPVKDANWATQIPDTQTGYVFLYDADGNYSKFKIVNRGGGVVGEAAWVEVSYIYNKAANSTKF